MCAEGKTSLAQARSSTYKKTAPVCLIIKELKQQRRRRLATKTSLKKWIRTASNLIALIPSRLLRQMLANVFGVEF